MEKIFIGTSTKKSFEVISQISPNLRFGVCLNMFGEIDFKKLEILESLKLPIFLDNGSFERFNAFLEKELTPQEYFNFENSKKFFEEITEKYKTLLNKSKDPQNIVLTIPEVIGSAELTQQLQKEYISIYQDLQKQYGFQVIVSLQFNPHSENWIEELKENASFIQSNVPNNWIVGIPFGNDFKILQRIENFKIIKEVFSNELIGKKAHLFACGSLGKIKKFALPNDFVYSIDASSIMNVAKYSHYLSTKSYKILDIRALKGKSVKLENALGKQKELLEDSGFSLE